MARTVYALLVGIDEYQSPVRPLHGCVNDITRVETFLTQRVGSEGYTLEPRVLKNDKATRQAVIDGFTGHLGRAGKDDVALFYFSGHGSQEKAPPEFWHMEPDRLNETLICYDSRQPGQYDLADKELAQLIADVADKGPHVVIILDSCHSGSGTRAGDSEGVRRAPTDERVRPIDSYIVTPAAATARAGIRGDTAATSGWTMLPEGEHILLAACRADEEAKEYTLGGEPRGIFSYFLTDTLERTGQSPTYRDLFKRVRALVRNRAALQSPQIEATDTALLDQPFLGGAIAERSPYFTLSYSQGEGWVIDGGAVHGIPAVAGEETTTLVLFPFTSTHEQMRDISGALGTARATEVHPHQSVVEVTLHEGKPDPDLTYKAVVTALPLPLLGVYFEGDEAGLELARVALHAVGPGGKPSVLVGEVAAEAAELRLRAADDTYQIMRPVDGRQLVEDIPKYTKDSAWKAIQRLEHIARWIRINELENPASTINDAVKMEIFRLDAQGAETVVQEAALRLEYTYREGKWVESQFRVKLTNTSTRKLYCMLLDLPQTFGVFPKLPGGGVWLEPGAEAWVREGKPIYARVPKKLWKKGLTEITDVLKLIVSTEESDATLLAQEDLDQPIMRSKEEKERSIKGSKSTLQRLMRRVQTRHFSDEPEEDEVFADWATYESSFTTVRPLESVPIPGEGEEETLGSGVTLIGHPSLQAKARLTTAPQASREVGGLRLPSLLRDDPEIVQPFAFTANRSGEPGLGILELFDVADPQRAPAAIRPRRGVFPASGPCSRKRRFDRGGAGAPAETGRHAQPHRIDPHLLP
jgi:hypothetical protein